MDQKSELPQFEDLNKLAPELQRAVMGLCLTWRPRDHDMAEEITQEVLKSLCEVEAGGRLRHRCRRAVFAWAARVAHRTFIRKVLRKRGQTQSPQELPADLPDVREGQPPAD